MHLEQTASTTSIAGTRLPWQVHMHSRLQQGSLGELKIASHVAHRQVEGGTAAAVMVPIEGLRAQAAARVPDADCLV